MENVLHLRLIRVLLFLSKCICVSFSFVPGFSIDWTNFSNHVAAMHSSAGV